MIKNSKDLDDRIKELTARQQETRSTFLGTSDKTRDVAGSVQQGMYVGQLALGLFRTITNFRLPPKKRIKRVLITLVSIVAISFARKLIFRKEPKA